MIELLSARLVFLFPVVLLDIYFRLMSPQKQTTPHYKHSWQSRTHKTGASGATVRPALHNFPTYTLRMWWPPSFVRPSDSADSPIGSHVACRVFQTAGQEGWTAAPHALAASFYPTPLWLPTSPTASHCAGQQPSEEPGRMRGDGQAVSGVKSCPLWPTSWTDDSQWHHAAERGKQSQSACVFSWWFVSISCCDG